MKSMVDFQKIFCVCKNRYTKKIQNAKYIKYTKTENIIFIYIVIYTCKKNKIGGTKNSLTNSIIGKTRI